MPPNYQCPLTLLLSPDHQMTFWLIVGHFQMKWSEVKSLSRVRLLWDPVDCSPPGSSVHGILQGRTLEWVDITFSRGSSRPRDQTRVSCVAGRFFTVWATEKSYKCGSYLLPFLLREQKSTFEVIITEPTWTMHLILFETLHMYPWESVYPQPMKREI